MSQKRVEFWQSDTEICQYQKGKNFPVNNFKAFWPCNIEAIRALEYSFIAV